MLEMHYAAPMAGAVLNAINDALTPFNVQIDEIPATPQRIRAALRAAEKAARKSA